RPSLQETDCAQGLIPGERTVVASCTSPSAAAGTEPAAAVPRPAPTRTCTTPSSTTVSAIDQNSREGETSFPHSRTTAPSTPTATRNQPALAATHRPVPPPGPSASRAPAVSKPPASVERTAVPEV